MFLPVLQWNFHDLGSYPSQACEISGDPEVANALFDIMETLKTLDSKAKLTPSVDGTKDPWFANLLAAHDPDRLNLPPAGATVPG